MLASQDGVDGIVVLIQKLDGSLFVNITLFHNSLDVLWAVLGLALFYLVLVVLVVMLVIVLMVVWHVFAVLVDHVQELLGLHGVVDVAWLSDEEVRVREFVVVHNGAQDGEFLSASEERNLVDFVELLAAELDKEIFLVNFVLSLLLH